MVTEEQVERALSEAFEVVFGFDPKYSDAAWAPRDTTRAKSSAKKGISTDAVVSMFDKGMSMGNIARELGVSYATVRYHVRKAYS